MLTSALAANPGLRDQIRKGGGAKALREFIRKQVGRVPQKSRIYQLIREFDLDPRKPEAGRD
jgi:hypothetical protein